MSDPEVEPIKSPSQHTALQKMDFNGKYLIDMPADRGELTLLSKLPPNFQPLEPLPQDPMADLYYPQKVMSSCTMCKTPWRTIAEHVYLDQGRKPQSVVLFFKRYFNARVTWECVDTHMKNHCDLRRIGSSGLKNLELRQDDMLTWQYRELELAITGILAEIDDIRGMEDSRERPELRIKKSLLLRNLYKDLVGMQQIREDTIKNSVNIFTVLHDIYFSLSDAASKQIIANKVQEIKEQLSKS